jgi:hypothetical protein
MRANQSVRAGKMRRIGQDRPRRLTQSGCCQSPGRHAILAVVALGSSAPSIPVGATAGARSRCCTVPAYCSPAGVATPWRMKAKMNHCTIAAFGRHRKSECGWDAARAWWKASRTSPKGCIDRPITGYAVPMILGKSVPTWASCNLSIACSDGCAADDDASAEAKAFVPDMG